MARPDQLFSLTGKVALVTGASSGLGEEFARTLAGAGARVVATARRLDRLEELAKEIDGLVPLRCDISREDELYTLVERAHAEAGLIDVLVNNAGIVGDVMPAHKVSRESFEEVLGVNLVAPMRLSALVLSDMRQRGGGSIISTASISGVVAIGKLPQAAYVASKSGLVGLTRELAVEWARYGVRVNAIAAGYFQSEMTSAMFAVPELEAWVEDNTPLRHRGVPQDFAGTLLLLASDAGRYITGQTLVVDGGWTAR